MEPHGGKDSQGKNKFWCLSSFLLLLVCFCRRSLRMRVERPTGPPPPARWRAHASLPAPARGFEPPVCKLAHLPSPRPPDNLASTSRARSPLLLAVLPNPQAHRRAPEKGLTSLLDPGAPLLHPRGFPGRSLLPPPFALWGIENSPSRAAGAQTVKRRKGKRGGRWP